MVLLVGEKRVRDAVETLGLSLTVEQEEQVQELAARLYERNSALNLTRIPPEEFLEKHFIDSLALTRAVSPKNGGRLIDVGTGAGFPALPLAICFPYLQVTALDATRKKIEFVSETAHQLGLRNVEVIHGRAEEVQRRSDHRFRYDVAVARAVAPLSRLAPWLLPFVAPGGVAVALKGPAVDEELEQYRAVAKRHWPVPTVVRFETAHLGVNTTRTMVRWQESTQQ